MKNSELIGLVLAAGKGTRMKSSLPKVLHRLIGQPLLAHVIDILEDAGVNDIYVVVGHGADRVVEAFKDYSIHFVRQDRQLGTGHAVKIAEPALSHLVGEILIICGDTPLFRSETLARFVKNHNESRNGVSILSAHLSEPTGYGRIIRDSSGRFKKIVEEKDASFEEKRVSEVNTGTYLVDKDLLFELVKRIDCDNAQGEFYLTDIVELATISGHRVGAFCLASHEEALGVNSRNQLAEAERVLLSRIRDKWMAQGVTISMPDTVYLEKSVTIGKDTCIGPFSMLKGATTIGEGVEIGAHSIIQDAEIPSGSIVDPYSYIKGT